MHTLRNRFLPKEFRALGLSFVTPTSSAAGSKRPAPLVPNSSSKRKRERSTSPEVEIVQGHSAANATASSNENDDEIVITGYNSPATKSSSSQGTPKPFDYKSVLRHFRLSPKTLG